MRSLALFALLTATLVNGLIIKQRETNAQRLQRGMKPLKPAKLFDPSRTGPELARRSTTPPPPPTTGHIKVVLSGTDTVTCYLQEGSCAPGDPNSESYANIWSASVNYGLQDIVSKIYSTGDQLVLSYFGDFTPGSGDQSGTLYNGQSSDTPGTFGFGLEGGIWTIAADGQMSATWTNDDGTPVSLGNVFLQDPTSGDIHASPNPVAYNTNYNNEYTLVNLYFLG